MSMVEPATAVRIHALGGFRLIVDGRELRLRTRKEATLLLRLALAGAGGITRDECVTMLWPESSEARARHSLSEAMRGIEQATRVMIVRSPERLRLEDGAIDVDANELDQAITTGDVDAAAGLWLGGFLAGWYPPTPEASHWVDAYGARLAIDLERAMRSQLTSRRQAMDSRGVSTCVALLEKLGVATDADLEAAAEAEQITGWESLRPGESIQARIPIDREGPFVGRVEEMKILTAELERALAGELRVVLVSGEAGIGKTRTCQRLARLAALRGARLFMSKCYELEQSVPFGALGEAFKGSVTASDLVEMRTKSRQILGQVLPEIAELTVGPPTELPGNVAHEVTILQAMLSLAEAVSRRRPAVLLVDDVQWADTATCQVLHYVARRINPEKGLLLLLATRAHELSANQSASILVREVDATRIQLHPLRPPEVRKQIAGLLRDNNRDRIEQIARRSGGNPFIARELALAGRGPTDLPSSIRDAIMARICRLPAIQQHVLGILAVGGGRIHVEALSAATQLSPSELIGPIAGLRTAGLIVERGSTVETEHDVLRSTVHASLGEPLRRTFHSSIARANSTHISAAARARHFEQAGLFEEASNAALSAASEAAFRFATSERLDLLELALRTSSGADRVAIAESFGTACLEAGQYGRAADVLSRVPHSPSISLKRHLAELRRASLKDFESLDDASARLNELLGAAGNSFPSEFIEAARLQMRLGHEADYTPMVVNAIDALLRLAAEVSDERYEAKALCVAAYQAVFYSPGSDVERWLQHALEIGRRLDDPGVVVQAELGRAIWAATRGRTDNCFASAKTAFVTARSLGLVQDSLRARMLMICADLDRLNFRRVIRQSRVLLGRADPDYHPDIPSLARLNSAVACLEMGLAPQSYEEAHQALAHERGHPYWLVRVNGSALVGLACLELGKLAEAHQRYGIVLDEGGDLENWMDDPGPVLRFRVAMLCREGRLVDAIGLADSVARGCRARNTLGYWIAATIRDNLSARTGIQVDVEELEAIRLHASEAGNRAIALRADDALAAHHSLRSPS